MTDSRKLPTGRFGRLAQLAKVGLRTGASVLLDQGADAAAKTTAEVLGNMRGLAAKIGQMASYVDGIIPEGQRDIYEGALASLRSQTPASPFGEVRATLETELGKPLEDIFEAFDEVPLASASIGQVHKARLKSGLDVAVKVQHVGIAEALESDLANGQLLGHLADSLGGKRLDAKGLYEVVKTRFREELDYGLEAERLGTFRRFHQGDPKVLVPQVFADTSTKRVLTTEFLKGLSFDDARNASEDERRAWSETLWRFVYRGNLEAGLFNADPHPGNYFFFEDGRVGFIDFGCCQVIPPDNLIAARRIHQAALVGDLQQFRQGVVTMLGAPPGPLQDAAVTFTRQCFEPIFASPFRVTSQYVASLVETFKTMALSSRKLKDDEFFTMPRDMLFINRLQFGFYSVLARLNASVDYAQVERGFVPHLSLTTP